MNNCYKIVNFFINNIKKKSYYNAFVNTYFEEALLKSTELDKKLSSNISIGSLFGMVIGLKDLICYKHHPVQASSKILYGFISQFSATVVERLIKEDAIIIGHQNCDQFGMGSSNENSIFGPVLNPFNTLKVSGGSSGGSAVSVQSEMCSVSLGSDTGGSVRQPASFCGVIGFKPTYSRISRYGLISYASSFDTIGIISKNVLDCIRVFKVISGKDNLDNVTSSNILSLIKNNNSKFKIAYINETLCNNYIQDDVKNRTLSFINFLKNDGHSVSKINYSFIDYLLPVYYIITTAESSSNLSRFDGIRYGYRDFYSDFIDSIYTDTRTRGFYNEVKKRILLGTFVLSSDYYDSYYLKAQKVRRLIKDSTEKILSYYDFIITPTTPTTAFNLGQFKLNPVSMYFSDLYTVQASLSGIPSISIPNGFDSSGLPVGIQVMTSAFNENKLLFFSNYLFDSDFLKY
jgi:aspartyl-tRNA(Asn)/glutamyl-tRNA(Gln) amidotransferase subunit A